MTADPTIPDPEIALAGKGDSLSGFKEVMSDCHKRAEALAEAGSDAALTESMDSDLLVKLRKLTGLKHAGRGIVLTLAVYKAYRPDQDIRRNMAEHEGGFAARRFDTQVTVRSLRENALPYNVETHWLTQIWSFGAGGVVSGIFCKSGVAA